MSQVYPPECSGAASCGTNWRYAHGCRGEACGLARLIWQRGKRRTKRPRSSKYDTPVPPEIIGQWRERLYGK